MGIPLLADIVIIFGMSVFTSFFFLSVGMLVDVHFLIDRPWNRALPPSDRTCA